MSNTIIIYSNNNDNNTINYNNYNKINTNNNISNANNNINSKNNYNKNNTNNINFNYNFNNNIINSNNSYNKINNYTNNLKNSYNKNYKSCSNTEPNSLSTKNSIPNENNKNISLNSRINKINFFHHTIYKKINSVKKDNKQDSQVFKYVLFGKEHGSKDTYDALKTQIAIKLAIKFEKISTENQILQKEYKLYKALQCIYGIPKIYFFGRSGINNILVRELLDIFIAGSFRASNFKFPLLMTINLVYNMILLIESIHNKGYIHGRLMSSHFLFGLGENNNKNLVSFGLSSLYIDPKTNLHIENKEVQNLIFLYVLALLINN